MTFFEITILLTHIQVSEFNIFSKKLMVPIIFWISQIFQTDFFHHLCFFLKVKIRLKIINLRNDKIVFLVSPGAA